MEFCGGMEKNEKTRCVGIYRKVKSFPLIKKVAKKIKQSKKKKFTLSKVQEQFNPLNKQHKQCQL